MRIEAKIEEMGLVLPEPMKLPPGLKTSFEWTRVFGNRLYVSGHGPLAADGSPAGPFGRVPSEVGLEEAQEAARKTGLAILSSIRRALGDLDRVAAWLMVNGMVNADLSYAETTSAINGFSDLILELYGPDVGQHARTAIGVSALPVNNAVVISAELAFE